MRLIKNLCLVLALSGAMSGWGADAAQTAKKTQDQQRRILICTAQDAPAALQEGAAKLAADADRVPLLHALLATGAATGVEREQGGILLKDPRKKNHYERAAFNHLVLIGLPQSDPLLLKCGGHQAALDEKAAAFYSEGYGHLQGGIGWIECDRNPFEYSPRIQDAPYSTFLVKITGTTPAGVLAALEAFRGGLNNGAVIADASGKPAKPVRPKTTLLDRDPDLAPPPSAPAQLPGGLVYAGWTQVAEDEYRAFADYGAAEPVRLWRLKYLCPGTLDGVELSHWNNGPHRKAFGSALTVGRYADAPAAAAALAALTKAEWRGTPLFKPVMFAGGKALRIAQAADMAQPGQSGEIVYTAKGRDLVLGSVPDGALAAYLKAMEGGE